MSEFGGDNAPKKPDATRPSLKSSIIAAARRRLGFGRARPSTQETPLIRKSIKSPDDLPLRNVALLIASIEGDEPFTVDELSQSLEVNHVMDDNAREILRRRVYELGTKNVIHGESTVDKAGNTTSVWNRTKEGDQLLEEIISPYQDEVNPL